MSILDEVLTATEAAQNWNLTEGAIRAGIKSQKFILNKEYRKAGRITLITKSAMLRVYSLDEAYDSDILNNVLTVTEAAAEWNITEGAIRQAIKNNKFILNEEYRKAGRITLITRSAMQKVYGKGRGINEQINEQNNT